MLLSNSAPKWCAGSLLAATAVMSLSTAASAAILTPSAGAFPASPAVLTADVNAFSDQSLTNENNITGSRVDGQTFTVDTPFTLGSVWLSSGGYGGNAMTMNLYSDTDPSASLPSPSNLATDTSLALLETISIPAGTPASGNANIQIALDPSEQLKLNAGGYFLTFQQTDSSAAGTGFGWRHMNDSSTNYYTGGHYYASGTQTSYRDFGLALTAANTATPEPASLSLLALGGAALLSRRRRTA